jgi:hypothetical protein
VWKTAVAGGITRVHPNTSLSHETCSDCTVGSTFMPITSLLLYCRLRLKCDGTRAETRFRLSAKRTSPFKSAGESVQSTTGSRGVRISGSNAGYTVFRGTVKSTGCPLHSPDSPSIPLPCVAVCHHILTGLYQVHCSYILPMLKYPANGLLYSGHDNSVPCCLLDTC